MADELVQAKLSFTMPIRGTTVSVNAPPLIVKDKVPTIQVLPEQTSVNEGSTAWFTLTSTNIPRDGSVRVGWQYDGTAADVTGGTGEYILTLDSNGNSRMGFDIIADKLTEGTETFRIKWRVFNNNDGYVYGSGVTSDIYINDTSNGTVNYSNLAKRSDDRMYFTVAGNKAARYNDHGEMFWPEENIANQIGNLSPNTVKIGDDTYTMRYFEIWTVKDNDSGNYRTNIDLMLYGPNVSKLATLDKSALTISIGNITAPLYGRYTNSDNKEVSYYSPNTSEVLLTTKSGAFQGVPSNAGMLNLPSSGSFTLT